MLYLMKIPYVYNHLKKLKKLIKLTLHDRVNIIFKPTANSVPERDLKEKMSDNT